MIQAQRVTNDGATTRTTCRVSGQPTQAIVNLPAIREGRWFPIRPKWWVGLLLPGILIATTMLAKVIPSGWYSHGQRAGEALGYSALSPSHGGLRGASA